MEETAVIINLEEALRFIDDGKMKKKKVNARMRIAFEDKRRDVEFLFWDKQ